MSSPSAQGDAQFARVLSWPNARELRRRLPPLVLGLLVLGFAIAISVRAELGVAPWDVFHQGVAEATRLSFGIVVVLTGLVVLLAWIPLRQRFGIGTVLNTLSIGFIANVGLYLIPKQHLLAVLVVGFALGGDVGIGTVLLALAIGPATHAGLRRFHLPVHDDAPEVLGE